MPVFEAHFHFQVQDLWVDGSLLGTRHELTFDGRRAFLQLPAHRFDFGLTPQTGGLAITGGIQAPAASELGESTSPRWSASNSQELWVS
jgi:hypothetical protein